MGVGWGWGVGGWVVSNSDNSKVVFSLFETEKLSVSISPRNLYISLKGIKENMSRLLIKISPLMNFRTVKSRTARFHRFL